MSDHIVMLSPADMLADAFELASRVHRHQKDKAGRPYILHPVQVMLNLGLEADDEQRAIAILHDVVEDSDITLIELHRRGYSQRVLDALSLLTHDKNVSYDVYVRAIGTNLDATIVKRGDLRHNSDITRMKGLNDPDGITDKDFARMTKYHKAFAYLEHRLAELKKEGCC